MARKLGGVKTPVIKVVKKERRIQPTKQKTFGTGVSVVGKKQEVQKATNVTREDIINIFGAKAVIPKPSPPKAITIDINEILKGLSMPKSSAQLMPAQTISRQKGLRTIGEIRQARYGRRVDPFGRFKGTAKL